MKYPYVFLILFLIMSAVLTVSGCTDSTTDAAYIPDAPVSVPAPGEIVNIDVAAAKGLIDSGSIFLVDVRTLYEYNESHISGSLLVPVQDLNEPEFLKAIERDIPKDKPILVYCRSGGRSVAASKIMAESGFSVYNMEGGIMAWEKAGYETIS